MPAPPFDPDSPLLFVINAGAGAQDVDAKRAVIESALAARGRQGELRVCEPAELPRVAARAAAEAVQRRSAVVAVGGDMAGAFDVFSAGLREGLFASTTALAGRDLQVVPVAHGEHAGLVGCAQLALDHVLAPAAVDAALRG